MPEADVARQKQTQSKLRQSYKLFTDIHKGLKRIASSNTSLSSINKSYTIPDTPSPLTGSAACLVDDDRSIQDTVESQNQQRHLYEQSRSGEEKRKAVGTDASSGPQRRVEKAAAKTFFLSDDEGDQSSMDSTSTRPPDTSLSRKASPDKQKSTTSPGSAPTRPKLGAKASSRHSSAALNTFQKIGQKRRETGDDSKGTTAESSNPARNPLRSRPGEKEDGRGGRRGGRRGGG